MRNCVFKRSAWKTTSSEVIVWVAGREYRYRRELVPIVVQDAFREMRRASALSCPPHLEFVESLRGAGGVYYDSLILIGMQDSKQIAEGIWCTYEEWVTQKLRYLCALYGCRGCDPQQFLVIAVQGRILAHEMGHAMRELGGAWTPFDNEEAAADFLAGVLDALRGRDVELGKVIFYSIGCEEFWCTHPSPCGRAHAYVSGYEYGRRVAAASA